MTQTPASLEQLLDFFDRVGMEPTAEEVAEILWLAARLPAVTNEVTHTPTLPVSAPSGARPESTRPSVPPKRSETFGPSATATATSAQGQAATANLYPVQAGVSEGGTAARTIRSPAAFALPGSLEVSRNLRPLKRRVPSRSHFVLDEAATAHHIADTADWTPVLSPAPERWLDVLLVVDESSSMVIWQRTIAELKQLLERQGAFRNVEILGFRAGPDNASVRIYTGIGPAANRSRLRRPAELIDPLARRLIAVVSDCVSPIWHNGVMATVLAGWGQAGILTLVQVLPDRLWVRTGLRTYPSIYLRSPAPGAPNSQFEIEWTTYRPKPPLPKGMAVPVVTLEALSLSYWARALAGNSNLWIPGVFAIPTVPVQAQGAPSAATPPRTAATATPDQLVRLFYGTASPIARRLASYLAAIPLTLPVMRVVQRALLPESRQVHLAEVWLSGLIDRPQQIDDKTPADSVEYFFVNGVCKLLSNNLRLGETLDVLTTVSGYVGERLGQPLDFTALIADPMASGELQIAQGYQSFARVAAGALRRFGGQYADLAQRLEISVYGEGARPGEPTAQVKIEPGAERKERQPNRRAQDTVVRALLVGTNQHASDKVSALKGAVDDVLLTREWLQSQCDVLPSNIRVLLDREATKQAIVAGWRQVASETQDGDHFYFHFSGIDQQIASRDPSESDGLDETLFAYDSIPGDRETLLTHQELADLAAEVEQRGGQVVLVLDSCRTASGWLARRALPNTLVLAAAAEGQVAYEVLFGGKTHGAVSYFLAESMKAYRPEMTWLDAYDHVLANVKAKGFKQTPLLIGVGDLAVFGAERRSVPPYLLVTKTGEREIEVNAPAALRLKIGENGARLAIYPPGSAMDEPPVGFARVQRSTEEGVTAVLETPATMPLASRVRVLDYGDAVPQIRVGLDDSLLKLVQPSSLVAVEPRGAKGVAFNVSVVDGVYAIENGEGQIVWRETPELGNTDSARAVGIRTVLEHIATCLRTINLRNLQTASELAGAVDLEVIASTPGDVITLAEDEPVMLRLRNRSTADLYISVWMLHETLQIQRIFPTTTPCVLLGKGRETQLAVTVHGSGGEDLQARMAFKVFASREPEDLGLLSLPGLTRWGDRGDLAALLGQAVGSGPAPKQVREKAAKTPPVSAPKEETWIPGGPVAVTSKLWKPGATLRIRFLSGDPVVRKKVRETALEWTQYANVRFEFVDKGDAQLRVGFDKARGSWSYIGTDCLNIPQDQPTINLGWLTATTPDEEYRRVVIHEFGHALGLAAAQQSPVAKIPWNKKATYEYYGKIGWDRKTIESDVFMTYGPTEVMYGPADPYSIMYHPIPKETTDGKIEIAQGTELSAGDKQFIAKLYPRGAVG